MALAAEVTLKAAKEFFRSLLSLPGHGTQCTSKLFFNLFGGAARLPLVSNRLRKKCRSFSFWEGHDFSSATKSFSFWEGHDFSRATKSLRICPRFSAGGKPFRL